MIQNLIEQNFDVYTRRACLSSALIIVLPVASVVLMLFPNKLTFLGILVSLIVSFGGAALLAQVARDMGKQKEPKLFAIWDGGKPTTRMLRHSTAPNAKILNYGFRRNLWSMKPLGIILSMLGILAAVIVAAMSFFVDKTAIPLSAIACSIGNLIFLILWLFVFTPNWVKIVADAYAERLLDACDNL